MRTSEATDQLMPALLAAKREMSPVFKGKKNDHFRYAYANEEAWYEAVQPSLLKHSLILTFSVPSSDRVGTLTTVSGEARITHAPSSQWIEVQGIGEGEDKADKAAYKAMTGLKKYLTALAFSLPTTDDVEDPAHDKRRLADEAVAKAKAAAPAASHAEINGQLAAQGIDPVPDPQLAEKRALCRKLYEQAKLIDKDEARIISKRWGTDYDRVAEELQLYLDGQPKKATP
jgi:hypothetical protein